MPVPLLDLRTQYQRFKTEIDAAVAEVFATQQFVGGPFVENFEDAMARYIGSPHAIGVASGTDALLLALRAVGIRPGDEVITTTFSFFATAGSIANIGATPIFVDIDPATFNLNLDQVADRITERTKAIVPVHLFGQCADMDVLMAIAQKYDLPVVEDAAQALGARYKNRLACMLGHMAAVSFYPTKNLGGAGDGGMVFTQLEGYATTVRLLRNHGGDVTYHHRILGANSRLDAIQAAVLRVKLKHLDAWNEQRRANAAYYAERFEAMPEIVIPMEAPYNTHIYHQYVIRLPRRDEAREFLSKRGIGSAVFYPIPLHMQDCFESFGSQQTDCPEAMRASREVLALPIHPELTPEQLDEVIDALKDHLAGK